MNHEPEQPQPIPEIPRGPLWLTLVIPPAVTIVLNVCFGLVDPGLSLTLPFVIFFILLGLAPRFHHLVGKRYRGTSLVFLDFSYVFGQVIVCLALWIGSCVLFFNNANLH